MRDRVMNPARKPNRPSPAFSSVTVEHRGTVLAFDFGEKRIGVASGELETGLAHALPGISAERSDARFAAIARVLAEWRPAHLVVGLPLATDGSAHAMTLRARRFARQLEGRFGLPVTLVDERYSSVESESADAGPHGVDSAAAQLILQQHFAQLVLQHHTDEHGR